ncbi:hypothetical protein ACOMHN_004704 [Nucella lapillus]
MKLQDRVDQLEQYGRRNYVRITSVPEVKGERKDDVVKALCKQIDIEITDDMIDRSHRVGRQLSVGEAQNRPILVQFCSYRYTSMVMGARKKWANLDLKRLVADADWPALSQAARSSGSRSDRQNTLPRVYIPAPGEIRSVLRLPRWLGPLKGKRKSMTPGYYDGAIFGKQDDRTYRVTTMKREMRVLGQE